MLIEKHPIIRDFLVVDDLPNGAIPVYDIDTVMSTVALGYDQKDGYVKPIILNPAMRGETGIHRVLLPMDLTHMIDYDVLESKLMECFIQAATINGNVFKDMKEVQNHFEKYELDMYGMITPIGDTTTYKMPSSINAIVLLGNGEYKWHRSKHLTDRVIILPPPEFCGVLPKRSLGIIPEVRNNKFVRDSVVEHAEYGLGIINTRGVCVLE